MCLAQGPQRSDASEAGTRGPSVSSQALYHWATAHPLFNDTDLMFGPIYKLSKFHVIYAYDS